MISINKYEELQNPSAEAGIICTLIRNPDFYFHSDLLTPKMFYDKSNGFIFYAIGKLAEKGVQIIDAYNILMILSGSTFTSGETKTITVDFLNELISEVGILSRDTVEEYTVLVKNVIDMAFRREVFLKLQHCESLCFKESEDDLQNKIFTTIDQTLSKYLNCENISQFGEIVDNLWNEMQNRQSTDGICGISSKIKELNNYFTYETEEMILVCAPRKEGKSLFCMNETIDKLERGYKVVYFDTEMSDRQHFERMLSYLTKIPVRNIKSGELTDVQKLEIQEAKNKIKNNFKYTHIYMTSPDMNKVYGIIKRMKMNNAVDFVVYDYIKSQNSISSSEIYNMLGEHSNFLKNRIAGELKLPVLACAQLNRSFEIADSYKLEQIASTVMLIKRKKQDEADRDGKSCGNYKFFIKCNRLGEQMDDISTDYVDVFFNKEALSFESCSQHDEAEKPF